MTTPKRPLAISMAYAAAVATAFAIAMNLLASALSTPTRFRDRLTALQEKTDSLRRVLRPHAEPSPYPSNAVCSSGGAEQQRLRNALTGQADATKMILSGLEIGPDDQAALGETLFPLRLRFQAQGSYEAALAMMQTLARERPVIFADAVDLTSKTSSVTLKFSGRIFCSAGT